MSRQKWKQLDNKFVRSEGILEEYFEENVSEVKDYFRKKYPEGIIEDHRNKHGTRIVVYEERSK